MNRRPALGMALLGSGLIAVTYGLARFAFGLFLPAIREDMAMSPELAGAIGSIPFASFVAAILLGPPLVRRVGAKMGGVTAISLALLGLSAIAYAPAPWMLAVGVAVCGVATGLSTPSMAAAVHWVVPKANRGRVNAAVNAGTSIGVALSGPAVLLLADAWRPAYFGFAAVAAVGLLAAAWFLPAHAKPAPHANTAGGPSRQQWIDMSRLSALAAATGFVSALYWVFAPDFAVQAGGLVARDSAWMWLAVGLGGLAGGAAGDMIAKHGPASSHAFATAAMAASLTLLAADPGEIVLVLFSAATFGAAYMTLTGIYLVGGTEIMPSHPALGTVMPFLAVAAGQVVGSSASGWMIAETGHSTAFASFAAFGLGVALISLWLTRAGQTGLTDDEPVAPAPDPGPAAAASAEEA